MKNKEKAEILLWKGMQKKDEKEEEEEGEEEDKQ